MKIFLKLLVLSMAISSILFFTSCSKDKKVEIRFDYSYNEGIEPYFENLEKTINEEGNYILKRESQPGLDHKDKVLVDVNGNNLADAFSYWAGVVNLKDFVDADLLFSIEDIFKRSDVNVNKEWFPAATWDTASLVNGSHYAFPIAQFQSAFIINTELLKKLNIEAPKTMQELVDLTPFLLDNGVIPISLGSKKGDGLHLFYSSLVYQFENGYKDVENILKGGNFDVPSHRKAAQTVEILRRVNAVPKDTISNGGWGAQAALYNAGKALMMQIFPWQGSDISEEIVKVSKAINIPMQDGATVDSSTFMVGGINRVVAVTKKAMEDEKRAKYVVDFLNKHISPNYYQQLLDNNAELPAATNLNLNQDNLTDFITLVYSAGQGKSVYPLHEFLFPSQAAFNNYKEACDLLLSGNLTADEFIDMVNDGLKNL